MKKIRLTKRIVLVIIISALSIILLAAAAGILINDGTTSQTEYVNEGSEVTDVSASFFAEEVFVQHDGKNQDIYFLSSQIIAI